ncbi:ABC transporter permease [Paenibacillus allorhizosphaerae]|uniref:Linearmycin resistance permease protein LnrM n=1 Tax=Paenibacillus allorhizosphaerae TaxID=2849866 RepID=A0ABN7TCJ1_9BACL|nr:ABC transporter permease [Paenibacillus allorhizosphaerae]CAG7622267.1 Linearmycin resistance permease protein LnrM [Paenibacillus allorhizosphaerae]
MSNVWIITMYELRRMSRLRSVMFVLFLLPLILIFILGAALSGEFRTEDVKLKPVKTVLVNLDQSGWNGQLMQYLDSPVMKKALDLSQAESRELAVRAIRSGSAEFGVVVPAGFGDKLMRGEPAEWELLKGSEHGQNLIAQTVFQSYIDYVNGLQAAVLATGAQAAPSFAAVQDKFLNEPQPDYVKSGSFIGEQKQFSAVQYYAAAMTVMFILYSGMAAAISMVYERNNHTLARLGAMPVKMDQIMAGKVLGNGLLSLVQSAVIVLLSHFALGVDWGSRLDLLLLVCMLLIVAAMSMAALVGVIATSVRTVTTLFQIVIILMTFLSGGFGRDMGEFIASLAPFTLSHWGMQSILRLMLDNGTATAVQHVGMLAAIAVVLAVVATTVYRKVGYRE